MDEPLAIVMAAGKGTRMQSDLPKVLVPARGRPLVEYVLDALEESGVKRTVVVVGYRSDDVQAALAHRSGLSFVKQEPQLGTGHAVQVCHEHLQSQEGPVAVLTGDSPMVQPKSLATLFSQFHERNLACLLGTLKKDNPHGLGRIVRNKSGEFLGIVEERDATEEQRQIREVNMSTYLFRGPALRFALGKLTNNNRQQEYYITDCPQILREAGQTVDAAPVLADCEALSVNTREELALVEAEMERLGYDA